MRKLFIGVIVFLIACSNQDKTDNFFEKEIQNKTQRTVKGSLAAMDSLRLSTFDVFNPGWLEENEKQLIIIDGDKFVVFNKQNFDEHYTIDLAKGKGPNEVIGVNALDVKDSLIALVDANQMKVLIGKIPEMFGNEMVWEKIFELDAKKVPHRINIIDSDSYLIFSKESGSEFSFNFINKKGVRINGFEKLPSTHDILLSLKYQGFTEVNGNSIYYAGFAEPILKKYNLEGEIAYSISTIDNYNTEANYASSEGNEQAVYGYAPGALFSTRNFDIYKNYWFVIPASNEDFPLTYLDIYSTGNGKYRGSFRLNNRAKFVQIDDQFIYIVFNINDEYFLKVYQNDIEQRF